MNDIPAFLKRAAEKSGLDRVVYNDAKSPTHPSNVAVLPLFGDIRGIAIASSLIIPRIKEISKYLIVASWPGMQSLFTGVDEYWALSNTGILAEFYKESQDFGNTSKHISILTRNLNMYLEDVLNPDVLTRYFNNGLTDKFWLDFKVAKRTMPSVPSVSILNKQFIAELVKRSGYRLYIYPTRWHTLWSHGKVQKIQSREDFWKDLITRLLDTGFAPVVQRNDWTFDMSPHFSNDCLYISETDIGKVMGAMRATGCVLDVFSGISHIAMLARCPFLALDERRRFTDQKDYEVVDLCANDLPKYYIFTFPTIIEKGGGWNVNLFDPAILKLQSFIPGIDLNRLPSASAMTEEVSYEVVREKKMKRIGARFIKVLREET